MHESILQGAREPVVCWRRPPPKRRSMIECRLLAPSGGSRRCSVMPAIEEEADGRETQSSAMPNTIGMVGDVVDVLESREAAN